MREKQGLKVDRKERALPDVIPQIRYGFRSSGQPDQRRIIHVKFRPRHPITRAPCAVNKRAFLRPAEPENDGARAPRFLFTVGKRVGPLARGIISSGATRRTRLKIAIRRLDRGTELRFSTRLVNCRHSPVSPANRHVFAEPVRVGSI